MHTSGFNKYALRYASAVLCCGIAFGQVSVLSQRSDNNRTGANLSETQLNTSNVNVSHFGKLFSYSLDDQIYAQPLYVAGVAIPSHGTHNVVYIATMNDSVYAFDADSNTGSNASPLWHINFTNPSAGITPVPITDIIPSPRDILGNVGIVSTPAIDASTKTMYLLARTKENGAYVQRLHALDITNGAEKFGGPVSVQASVSGSGSGNSGGVIAFDPKIENQRTSLALANGRVFLVWASHEDQWAYHGWVMSYDEQTLQQVSVYCDTPNGSKGGIWTSGWAPAVDASGNFYTISGNGDWDGVTNFGESFLKFSNSSTPALVDWFTPDDYAALNSADEDLGASGAMLLPGTTLVAGGGKSGILYLLQDGGLGHEQSGNMQVVQALNIQGGMIFGGPVYWNRSTAAGGPMLYIWSNNDKVKSFHFNGSTFDSGPVAEGTIPAVSGYAGGVLAFSSNGNTSGTGIVWSSMPLSARNSNNQYAGVLRAMDAGTLTELWDSNQNSTRDNPGTWGKFISPVVANGKVYVASLSNQVTVYGLLPTDFTVAVSPSSKVIHLPGTTTYTINLGQVGDASWTVALSAAGLPSGVTASFNPATVTGAGSSTLTLTASSSVAAGTYSFTVTGASGGTAHSASATLAISSATAGQGAISTDFVGSGTAMSSQEVAGVIPRADWNSAGGAASSSALALVDETGTATGASASWSAPGTYSLGLASQSGDVDMMNGYLDDSSGAPTTVSVSGLPLATYDVYLYADSNNGSATKTASYKISGAGITTTAVNLTDAANTNFAGTYTQANNGPGNYVKFTVTASAFTLTATPVSSSDNNLRAPVNGMQIVRSSSQAGSPSGAAMVWQNPSTGASQIWTLAKSQPLSISSTVSLTASNAWRVAAVADFNQDGIPDVVWQDPNSGSAQVWLLGGTHGTTITGTIDVSGANSWRIVAAGDFNGDGHPDLIWQDPNSGASQIWLLGGTNGVTVIGTRPLSGANAWRIAGAADFNADGIADVVWEDPSSGTTQVWYLRDNAQNPFASAQFLTAQNAWRVAYVGALDSSGHADVVWQDPASGTAQIWYLGGAQGLTLSGTASLSGSTSLRIAGPMLSSH